MLVDAADRGQDVPDAAREDDPVRGDLRGTGAVVQRQPEPRTGSVHGPGRGDPALGHGRRRVRQQLGPAAGEQVGGSLRVPAQVAVRALDAVGAVVAAVDDQDAAAVAGQPERRGQAGGAAADDDGVDLGCGRAARDARGRDARGARAARGAG